MNARARRQRALLRELRRTTPGQYVKEPWLVTPDPLKYQQRCRPWAPFVALPGEIGLTVLHDKILDVLHTIVLEDPEESEPILRAPTGYDAYLMRRYLPEWH